MIDIGRFEESIIDLKIDFSPHPCFIDTDIERHINQSEQAYRKVSPIFSQPTKCKER